MMENKSGLSSKQGREVKPKDKSLSDAAMKYRQKRNQRKWTDDDIEMAYEAGYNDGKKEESDELFYWKTTANSLGHLVNALTPSK